MAKYSLNLLILAVVAMMPLSSVAAVKAVGLLPGTAILEIDGQSRVLKQGETSPEGIRLIRANSREAVIEWNGKRQTLGLGTSLSSGYKQPLQRKVHISRGKQGHYWVSAQINGQSVRVLVDTGASHVAISSQLATKLGIDYLKGKRSRSSTAGGIVRSWLVTLNKVQVGDIVAHNVQASVIEGAFPREPLLGMSFLQRTTMSEEAGMLVLTQ